MFNFFLCILSFINNNNNKNIGWTVSVTHSVYLFDLIPHKHLAVKKSLLVFNKPNKQMEASPAGEIYEVQLMRCMSVALEAAQAAGSMVKERFYSDRVKIIHSIFQFIIFRPSEPQRLPPTSFRLSILLFNPCFSWPSLYLNSFSKRTRPLITRVQWTS